ncbi:hypothetical protein QYF36_007150 [Acer negundo]|nr:hypothetical protein QYF36_007150 [Acer negundo]
MIKMVFAKLINLQLKGLPNLTRFGSGNSVEFHSLTQLSIEDCPKLKTFSSALTSTDIKQSNEIEQMNCQYDIHPLFGETFMEAVIITQGERTSNTLFPKLYRLHLKHLPKLTSFCNFEGKSLELPSLDLLWIENCPKMHAFVSNSPDADIPTNKEEQVNSEQSPHANIQPLFDEKVGFRGIENFTVSDFPDLKEVWHNQLLITYFCNLKSLVVDDKCSSLKYLFTQSLALGLVQLQELEIKNCAVLEAIIVTDEERTDNTLFPNLTRLELKDLPKLLRFCNFLGNSIELPSLARLWIDNCPNMETFISGSTDANMPASKECWAWVPSYVKDNPSIYWPIDMLIVKPT